MVRADTGSMASNGSSRNKHPGRMQQGRGQGDLLAHPVGVVDHKGPGRVAEAEHLQQLAGPRLHHRRRHPPQQPVVGEQLGPGQPVEQAQVLGQHPDPPLGRHRVAPHLDPVDQHQPGVGPQQPRHHPQGGRLPGPVRPDQPEEGPMGDVQVEPGHRQLGPERLAQPPHRQRGRRACNQRRRIPCSHTPKPIPSRSYTARVDPSPAPEEPGASPDLLDGLNDAQRQAVLATEGPTLIVAGAGSGKTRVLTHRIAHLIKDRRVPPTSVLAITFTNKAAREMQERLRHLVGPVVKAMWVSTFHSACVRILRRSGSHLGYTSTFSIYDEGDAERLMTQVCRQLDFDPKRLPARSMRHAVSGWKDQLVDPEAAADRALGWFEKKAAEAYRLYQRRLGESNAMDFDDLILQTVRLFQEHPDVLAEYQQRFRYVLVDEFQDTNVAQYELLKLLAAEHRSLSVVGDGDQSIYAFRGATVRNILDFEADYPEANVILLEQNYRSTQTILSAA